jgi:hypothetical protein
MNTLNGHAFHDRSGDKPPLRQRPSSGFLRRPPCAPQQKHYYVGVGAKLGHGISLSTPSGHPNPAFKTPTHALLTTKLSSPGPYIPGAKEHHLVGIFLFHVWTCPYTNYYFDSSSFTSGSISLYILARLSIHHLLYPWHYQRRPGLGHRLLFLQSSLFIHFSVSASLDTSASLLAACFVCCFLALR